MVRKSILSILEILDSEICSLLQCRLRDSFELFAGEDSRLKK